MKKHNGCRSIPTVLLWVPFLNALLLLSCAQVEPPPGGPEDKQGPFVIGSEPPNADVQTPLDDKVTIYFSETVKPPSQGKTVFISPRPSEDPDVNWKSDRLVITFPDTFEVDQTYIVSVAAGVVDLRGNKMDSSLTVAFSTGPTIAKGSIAGTLYNARGSFKAGGTIALYDLGRISDSTEFDSIYAAYVTQSNSEGGFELSFLPDGDYLLLAFEDLDRDERLNPLRESFGLPDRPIQVGAEVDLSDLHLTVYDRDTTLPSIVSATNTPNGLVRVRFRKKADVGLLIDEPERIWLSPHADSTARLPAKVVTRVPDDLTDTLQFYVPSLPEGGYYLHIAWDSSRTPQAFPDLFVMPKEDQIPPSLLMFEPNNVPRLVDDVDIRFTFSEPIDSSSITDGTFVLMHGANRTVTPLVTEWINPMTIRLLADSLLGGTAYRLELVEFEISDRAGNRLGDSLRTFNFRTISNDSLGSIEGAVTVAVPGKEEDPVVLTFTRLDGKMSFSTTTVDGRYAVEVPGGKYRAAALVDSDGNGEPGRGSLKPLRYAETMASWPDTVSVRARFETAGIDYKIK